MESFAKLLVSVPALLLLAAGVSKLPFTSTLRSQVAAYDVLPAFAIPLVALLLPSLEILSGATALTTPMVGGWIASGLYMSFAFAIGLNLVRGRRELVCGCFGRGGGHRISFAHLLALCAAVLVCAGMALNDVQPGWIDIAGAVSATLAAGIAVVTARHLAMIRQWRRVLEEAESSVV